MSELEKTDYGNIQTTCSNYPEKCVECARQKDGKKIWTCYLFDRPFTSGEKALNQVVEAKKLFTEFLDDIVKFKTDSGFTLEDYREKLAILFISHEEGKQK
jgi:hypothetical protein